MKFKVLYTDNHGISYEWFTGYRRIHAELQPPPSQIWFCRVCGLIYAQVDIEPKRADMNYISIASLCQKHTNTIANYSIYTGGSILAENLNDIMELPAELVEKEFWIHLRETERLIKLERLGDG